MKPLPKLSDTAIAAATHQLHIDGFLGLCAAKGLPMPVREFHFHPTRKWRWDWAWPDHKLALEEDGGIYTRGKHSRGSGIAKDHEKRNAATALGWRYLLVQPRDLCRPSTANLIAEALGAIRASQDMKETA